MSTAIAGKLTLILASCIVWRVERQGEVLLKEFNYTFPEESLKVKLNISMKVSVE